MVDIDKVFLVFFCICGKREYILCLLRKKMK